jgi:hypothetical protein
MAKSNDDIKKVKPFQFYKANKAATGTAVTFNFDSKELCVYVELIKQTGWDEANSTGSFKGGAKGNVKFSLAEVGSIIDVIETTLAATVASDKATLNPVPRAFSGYHSGTNANTKIAFTPYKKKLTQNKDGQDVQVEVLSGLSFSVSRKTTGENSVEQKFLMGFTFGEAVILREFFKNALVHCFDAIYSGEKARALDYKKKKDENQSPEQAPEGESPEAEDPLA